MHLRIKTALNVLSAHIPKICHQIRLAQGLTEIKNDSLQLSGDACHGHSETPFQANASMEEILERSVIRSPRLAIHTPVVGAVSNEAE